MQPMDGAFKTFCSFTDGLHEGLLGALESEAEVRMKLIDPIFANVLGWPIASIHLETSGVAGRIDYRFTINERSLLIVEAKNDAKDLGINPSYAARYFRLNGPVFRSEPAKEAIRQLIGYCGSESAELACATNGHQWFVFRGNRAGDGTRVDQGLACVFGSLQAVRDGFATFYDLLSFSAVQDYKFRACFLDAEKQPLRSTIFRMPVRRSESRAMVSTNRLSGDLERVMVAFFRDIADDPVARKQCFVSTPESHAAESALVRISEDLRNKVRSLDAASASQITDAILRVKEMRQHEFVLLVGTKGSGKSTFVERFFSDVLPDAIAHDCIVIRVDLTGCGCDASTVIQWLDVHLLQATESAAFSNREYKYPTYDELQGMFFGEYERRRQGPFRYLYESDKNAFKVQFGEWVDSTRKNAPQDYIVGLLRQIVASWKKIPCLVFDNADHFDVSFQETVFRYANSIYSQAICLVIVPITDTTSWQLSKDGALQSFFNDAFFLPAPRVSDVLRRRIEFIEERVGQQPPEVGRGYFFGKGMALEVSNIRAFAACLQRVFLSTGEVAHWIGRLANGEVRRSLQLTHSIIASPYIRVDELVKAFISGSAMNVRDEDVRLAIIRGGYDVYPAGTHSYVQNVFDMAQDCTTTPLLAIRILRRLRDAFDRNPEADTRFVCVRDIAEYFRAVGIEQVPVLVCLTGLLRTGLVLAYDPTEKEIRVESRVQVGPSGMQHLMWGMGDMVYLESMAAVTPLLEQSVHDAIAAMLISGEPQDLRSAIGRFVAYLIREDEYYVKVPPHELYVSQQAIIDSLKRLIRDIARMPAWGNVGRYSRWCGEVKVWKREAGYGFVALYGGVGDALLHRNDIASENVGHLEVGTIVEVDIERNADRLKARRAIIIADQ